MEYDKAVEWLYNATPQFQKIGAAAYKPGLDTARRLAAAYGNPHMNFPIIHVGGTNGKGSTSHTLAAVLQSAGYKVGLYTSPHLVDFRERIRINGEKISRVAVSRFVEDYKRKPVSQEISPSFFELTTIMAFEYFAGEKVDVAVVEVGLGGRLDTTNIITPILSVITNISLDHMAQLGDTKELIALEKAGIIKKDVPVVIGETDPAIQQIFKHKAVNSCSSCIMAQQRYPQVAFTATNGFLMIENTPWGKLEFQLCGDCQRENALTIMAALEVLAANGFNITGEAVRKGFSEVTTLTGLMGRWTTLGTNPLCICDTGHNIGGWEKLAVQLQRLPRPLTMVLGFVNDKDTTPIFQLLPRDCRYIFTRASIPRALAAEELASRAKEHGIAGQCIPVVNDAFREALQSTPPQGSVFVGGSTFVVADLLTALEFKA